MKPINVKYKCTIKNPMAITDPRVAPEVTIQGIGQIVHFSVRNTMKTQAIVQCNGSGKFHECDLEDVFAIEN